MSKILIVGGTGFVGANTARAFADKKVSVVVTTRGSSQKNANSTAASLARYSDLITVETVDLTRSAEVSGLFSRHRFDGMVMLAVAHQDATSRAANNAIYDITLNCLDAASAVGLKRCVMASSFAVYGGVKPPFNEEIAFPQEISYEDGNGLIPMPKFEVRIKRILEQILLDYGTPLENPTGSGSSSPSSDDDSKQSHTLEVVALRFPFQFGPGYTRMGNPLSLAAHAVAGKIKNLSERVGYMNLPLAPLWTVLGAIVPPLYVKDTASAIVTAMEAETLPHRIYNVTGNYTSSAKAQLEALYRAAPEARGIIGIAPEEFPDEDHDLGSSPDLIKQDLGWTPSYNLEQAFEDYLDWLKDNPY